MGASALNPGGDPITGDWKSFGFTHPAFVRNNRPMTTVHPARSSASRNALDSRAAGSAAKLDEYRMKFAARLPHALTDLQGPDAGMVEPPPTVVWSGLRVFDLGNPRQRMSLYRIVLAEGMRADLCALLDRATLLTMWPTLRTLIAAPVREVWEGAFVELREAARTGTPQPAPAARPVRRSASRTVVA